jgi:hypothetical protein
VGVVRVLRVVLGKRMVGAMRGKGEGAVVGGWHLTKGVVVWGRLWVVLDQVSQVGRGWRGSELGDMCGGRAAGGVPLHDHAPALGA